MVPAERASSVVAAGGVRAGALAGAGGAVEVVTLVESEREWLVVVALIAAPAGPAVEGIGAGAGGAAAVTVTGTAGRAAGTAVVRRTALDAGGVAGSAGAAEAGRGRGTAVAAVPSPVRVPGGAPPADAPPARADPAGPPGRGGTSLRAAPAIEPLKPTSGIRRTATGLPAMADDVPPG